MDKQQTLAYLQKHTEPVTEHHGNIKAPYETREGREVVRKSLTATFRGLIHIRMTY
jgi:hypothetical protein